MKNKFKKYWKEILIGVLVLFGMNKCTTSCKRSNKIDKLEVKISQQDSLIKFKNDTIKDLRRDLVEYENKVGLLKKFDNECSRQDSINQINTNKMSNVLNRISKKLNKINICYMNVT